MIWPLPRWKKLSLGKLLKGTLPVACISVFCLLPGWAASPSGAAPTGLPLFTSQATAGGQEYTLTLQTLLFLTALTFLPAALLMMTAFTRIVIVLSLLRQGLGTLQAPTNQVVIGLSLFLTLFVMSPVLDKIWDQAYKPYSEGKIIFQDAVERGGKPLKEFMLRQTREKDLALFISMAKLPKPKDPEELSFRVLIPAFVTSELKTAFQIAFLVLIPFLLIDLVVASVLMSMGMMMVSPITIALPFKLMLFVLVDGWGLLLTSLVQSFYV